MKSKKSPRLPLTPTTPPPSPEQIEALAHAIWLDRGRPEGRDLDHWLEAERQLSGRVTTPLAADELPATADGIEPTRALEGRVERELDRIIAPREQRSPTSL
jgi:hypothetical protein